MLCSESYNKEAGSSDFNSHSPESFSDSEKREGVVRGEVSTLSEGRIAEEGKEGKVGKEKKEGEMRQESMAGS